jgi:hypothetical protein
MTGYGALASMMASHQNAEAFRKFSSMNMENILHMQAELQHLEVVIDEVRKIPALNSFDRIWIESPEHMSEDDIRKIFERSRALLDEYCRGPFPKPLIEGLALTGTQRSNPLADGENQRHAWSTEEQSGAAAAVVRRRKWWQPILIRRGSRHLS